MVSWLLPVLFCREEGSIRRRKLKQATFTNKNKHYEHDDRRYEDQRSTRWQSSEFLPCIRAKKPTNGTLSHANSGLTRDTDVWLCTESLRNGDSQWWASGEPLCWVCRERFYFRRFKSNIRGKLSTRLDPNLPDMWWTSRRWIRSAKTQTALKPLVL